MINESLARRYAQALFLDGQKENCIDRLQDDLKRFAVLLQENDSFLQFWQGQLVSMQEKKKLVDDIFVPVFHPLTISFLHLLLDKGRESGLLQIVATLKQVVLESQGILSVKVKSAMPMELEQQGKLKEKLNALTGKQVELDIQIDSSLIGGLTVSIGDIVYDGSLANQLQKLAKDMQN